MATFSKLHILNMIILKYRYEVRSLSNIINIIPVPGELSIYIVHKDKEFRILV